MLPTSKPQKSILKKREVPLGGKEKEKGEDRKEREKKTGLPNSQKVPKVRFLTVPDSEKENCLSSEEAQKVYDILHKKEVHEEYEEVSQYMDFSDLVNDLEDIGIVDEDRQSEEKDELKWKFHEDEEIDRDFDVAHMLGDSLFPGILGSGEEEFDYDYLLDGWNAAVHTAKNGEESSSFPEEYNVEEESDEDEIDHSHWSILSTTPTYPCEEIDRNSLSVIIPKKISHKTKKFIGNCADELPPKPKDSHPDQVFDEIDCKISQVPPKLRSTFDEIHDIATTYLGKYPVTELTKRETVEQQFSIRTNSTTEGKLCDGTSIKTLFDTGATRSYLSYEYYKKHPVLHSLPRYPTRAKGITMGNGGSVGTKFIIPIQVNFQGHLFEIHTLVAHIDPSMDLVFGIKNMFEVEGTIDTRSSTFKFMDRAVWLSLDNCDKTGITLRPDDRKEIVLQAKHYERLDGAAVIKFYWKGRINTRKVKFQNSRCVVQVINNTKEDIQITRSQLLGIVDLRSLGYYEMSAITLQQHLSSSYSFIKPKEYAEAHNKIVESWDHLYKMQQSAKTIRDPYPWLDQQDPRRHMSDIEILDQAVDLSQSKLTRKEKKQLKQMIFDNKDAFSLRDEIGHCPNMTIDIQVIDDTDFFVRPYPISETDKPFMDRQMERLVHLGILTKNSTAHTSPVMLISRKITRDKRPVSDFRVLNTRIVRKNTTMPLMRDIVYRLGNSKCELASIVDVKDAFHSIKLTPRSKEFCGILPYFGSPCYRYEVMPMGLSISPAKWLEYVDLLLGDVSDKSKFIAIMDDLLVHSRRHDHLSTLEDLFKAIIKHGLKLSPKKCQLAMTNLTYMGNNWQISKEGKVTVTPLKTRLEAIQKLTRPTTVKQCKSFCGVVNYLSMFCPELQALLKPIYKLTRKGCPFVWTEEQDKSFNAVKERLLKPPVLHCPTPDGRYILYSDTSRKHCGSALWQVQNGEHKLLGYASKTLPPACENYSVTELEMYGLLKNMDMWKYWFGNQEFDCAVDHKAIVAIVKAKKPPATNRIANILNDLAGYNFNLYYVKGKDLLLTDFLSRSPTDTSNPHKLQHISFEPRVILNAFYKDQMDSYNIGTRSSYKKEGIVAPEVHGANKTLDPNIIPEKAHTTHTRGTAHCHTTPRSIAQTPSFPTQTSRAQLASRKLVKKAIRTLNRPSATESRQTSNKVLPTFDEEPELPSSVRPNTRQRHKERVSNTPRRQDSEDAPRHIEHIPYDPLLDLEGPSVIEKVKIVHRAPILEEFQKHPKLDDLLVDDTVVQQFLPKQKDINKVFEQIQRKVLRQVHLPSSLRDLEAAYLASPHFRDIFIYLSQNKLPIHKKRAKQTLILANHYLLLDRLLFKVTELQNGEYKTQLCIPTSKVDMLLQQYHTSLIGSHQGITKCFMTLQERFHCPNLAHHVRAYITGCHVCQIFKGKKNQNRPFKKRVHLNTPAMSMVSMDIKYMPKGHSGFKYLLVLICETSNFIVVEPLRSTDATHICKALERHYIRYFGSPTHIVCDQDPAFTSGLMHALTLKYNTKLITVGTTNHKSLQAEHGIKSIASLLKKHLTHLGNNWPNFTDTCMLAYNSYASPNMDGLSPYELVFGHKMKICPNLEVEPDAPFTGSYKLYHDTLKKRLSHLKAQLQKFRDKRHELLNKDKELHSFHVGQLVYMYQPKGADLQTGTRKFTCEFVGPLVVYKAVSPNQFLLMTLDGKIYPHLIEETRIKAGYIRTPQGNVTTLAQLKSILKADIKMEHLMGA